ncbi:hypothetical protein NHX12_010332, partial [Muraenolepis orangiensis]
EGSTDSIYEPPHHNQGIRGEVVPRCGSSPALLRKTPVWGGSDPCISPSAHLWAAEPHGRLRRLHRLWLVKKSQSEAGRGGQNVPESRALESWGSSTRLDPSLGPYSGTNEEMERCDRSKDKVNGGQVFTGEQTRRSSNSFESLYSLNSRQSSSSGVTSGSTCSSNRSSLLPEEDLLHSPRFCARARVHTDFVPSPYDMESLRLKVGDVIDVIAKPTMGIWRGMLNGKIGSFKFVYVDVLEDGESEKYQSHKPWPKSRPQTLEELLKHHSVEECCSILRLHGYQAVEDLARLREHRPTKRNEIGPDERRRLLAAVEALQEPQCGGGGWDQGSETPTANGVVDPRTRARDSGCHMLPSNGSDNGRDDAEIRFPFISPPTLDQISAV